MSAKNIEFQAKLSSEIKKLESADITSDLAKTKNYLPRRSEINET